jgi:hypothetical protein
MPIFKAAAVLAVWLQVTERYPWSGELAQNGRRDMRRGRQLGIIALVADVLRLVNSSKWVTYW